MFRDNTVFVIGASASFEFGLPVGSTLLTRIRKRAKCRRDRQGTLVDVEDNFLGELIDRRFTDPDEKVKCHGVLDAIYTGIETAVSIDAFIDRFQNNERVALLGKLLIALEIAEAERHSIMSPEVLAMQTDENVAYIRAGSTWIGRLPEYC